MPDIPSTRGRVHYLQRGLGNGIPVLLIHGNVSSSPFFEPLMADLPAQWQIAAPDLRGYGDSEARPIDATRGLAGWSDDLWAFLDALGWSSRPIHVLGWSMGAGIAMQMAIERPERLMSLTLVSPLSPYGFGGTRDATGTPTSLDFAGSGGGTVNPQFVQALAAGDRGDDLNSPRSVMHNFYFHPGFQLPPALEEAFVSSMLSTRIGDDYYPGDFTPSDHWPNVAPGTRGITNAMSPRYVDLSGLADISEKPPILWVRGAHDLIVSDRSMFDLDVLGEMGLVPGWPGPEDAPPQPMVQQMRTVLDRYAERGHYQEIVFEGSAHSPHIEEPESFTAAFTGFVREAEGNGAASRPA